MALKQVTKEEFFKFIYSNQLDVHPCPEPHKTNWELRNRQLIGVTTPGYKLEGEKTYSLVVDN